MLKENSSYADQPKTSPTGAGRINPIRSQGESELRLHTGNADFDGDILKHAGMIQRLNPDRLREQVISAEQVNQALFPRGYATDVNSEIFARPINVKHWLVKRSLTQTSLKRLALPVVATT